MFPKSKTTVFLSRTQESLSPMEKAVPLILLPAYRKALILRFELTISNTSRITAVLGYSVISFASRRVFR
jgi:hypothetical protein